MLLVSIGFSLSTSGNAAIVPDVVKKWVKEDRSRRAYYLFVPSTASSSSPAPLLVTLHGSGRDGRSLVASWRSTAEREGIVVVGVDATNRQRWTMPADALGVRRVLDEVLQLKHPRIDDRRVYVFGHSAGAVFGLYLSLLQPEYFAAAAVHAGAFGTEGDPRTLSVARRKIPIAMLVGTNDPLFPLPAIHETRDLLAAHGFPIELMVIAGHGHDYYSRADEINMAAWAFLEQHALAQPPRYAEYEFKE